MHIYLCSNPNRMKSEELVRKYLKDYSKDKGLELSETCISSAVIERGIHGKPFFADFPQVYFSVSHSGKYWTCAFGTSRLGIDIEDLSIRPLDQVERWLKIAKRFFTSDEYEYVVSNGARSFFEIWVRKEAYLKYTGTGIMSGLSCINLVEGNKLLEKAENTCIKSIDICPSVTAACCSDTETEIERIKPEI